MRGWRDYQDSPVERVYGAALAGDPLALLAIELMPDRAETAVVTKSRKGRKAGRGEILRNLSWHEQVDALRRSQAAGVLKAACDVAASGYDEAQFLRDLQRAGQYQGHCLRPGRERP